MQAACKIKSIYYLRYRYLALLTVLVLCTYTYAQPTVLVNGIRLEKFDNTTVSGIDYVDAQELSEAIGANLNTSDVSLQFELAGAFVLMPVFNTVQEAQDAQQALEFRRFGNSQQIESTGALKVQDNIMIPLKSVVSALGGSVDYVAEANSVIAVFERADLAVLAYPQPNTNVERFVFNLSVPVNYKVQDMKSLSVLNILFAQTNSQLGTQPMTGKGFQRALFRNFAGDVEFRLELRPGYKADVFSSPPTGEFAGYKGVNIIIDVLADEAFEERYAVAESNQVVSNVVNTIGATDSNSSNEISAPNVVPTVMGPVNAVPIAGELILPDSMISEGVAVSAIGSMPPTVVSQIGTGAESTTSGTVSVVGTGEPVSVVARSSRIVLDPAPLSTLSSTTADTSFDFVAGLAADLQGYGFSSSITRAKGDASSPESRRNAGIGAAAFISFNQSEITPGTFNLYYLGEAESLDTLDLALRQNAERAIRNTNPNTIDVDDETAAIRRNVLLNLSSTIDEGSVFAQSISRGLSAKGYQLTNIQALPLYVLGGAVGKGIVVEVSSQDINNPALRQAMLEAILELDLQ